MSLDFSAIAVIIYASFYASLLVVISVITYRPDQSKSKWISVIWKQRGIYLPILVHIYDTSTDIGVIIIWADLAFEDMKNPKYVEHIDMLLLFILALVFIVIYRIAGAFGMIFIGRHVSACLAIFDLAIIYEVHESVSHSDGDYFTEYIECLKLAEAVLESVPQILLQSVFIIRTFKNEDGAGKLGSQEQILIFASIFASSISIANKFVSFDHDYLATTHSQNANLCHGMGKSKSKLNSNTKNSSINSNNSSVNCACSGCISFGWVVCVMFRYWTVTSRVIVCVLMWSVVCGYFLIIYIFLEFVVFGLIVYWVVFERGKGDWQTMLAINMIYLVGIIGPGKYWVWFARLIDDVIMMALITMFSSADWLGNCDSNLCSDKDIRNIIYNESVFFYVVMGWSSIVLYSILGIIGHFAQFLEFKKKY